MDGASEVRPMLLDYGSGYGQWARAAVAAGFDVVAFEPSRSRGADVKAQAAGFAVVHNLNDIGLRQFDAINLEQVLEHISAASEALSELLTWTTPRTVLRVATPNLLRCPEGDKLYETWPYDGTRAHTLAPFEHVNGFTPMSLVRTAERGGWVGAPLSAVARVDPAHVLRRLAGWVDPRMDQTLLYAVPAL
jgi:SAM-dependent methyltransferase